MFPLYPNHPDESKTFHFIPLSPNTPLQGTQQFQTPCLDPNMNQPTKFALSGTNENPHESQENWMRMKRQRGQDGESMDISKWSGSSHFQMNGVANVVESIGSASFGVGHGGGDGYRYYRNYPYGPYSTNGFGVKNANEVSVQRTVGLDGMETPASEKVRRRMIKNRESAARSRARKLAHNAQLQIEIMELKKENELLRRVMKVLSATVRTKSENMPTSSRAFSEPL